MRNCNFASYFMWYEAWCVILMVSESRVLGSYLWPGVIRRLLLRETAEFGVAQCGAAQCEAAQCGAIQCRVA